MRNSRRGFTIVEILMALFLSATFLTAVMSAWFFSSKTFHQENLQGRVRFDLHKAMEWMKEDVRLTNGSNILFYPAGASTFTGISIPKATPNANGFYTLSSSLISWDTTVIYHVFDNGGTMELRRTIFDSYLSSSAARQTQLDSVVSSGGDNSASTRVLAEGDEISLEISPTSPTFDGYSANLEPSENTSFGSKQMTAGNHTVRFIAEGKNSASSGYKMGFDQLSFTPSGSGQEAEILTISASSGGGSTLENMTSFGEDGVWHGNYQLEYQSSAVGNYVEFQVYYDRWIESNFDNAANSYTEVEGDDPAVRVTSRENQSVLPSWKADSQTGVTETDNTGFHDKTVRNILDADFITSGGEMVRFKFKASAENGSLVIQEAHFGGRDTTNPFDFSGLPSQLYFGNATVGPGDSDGVGATGSTGATSIAIPQGHYVWSNWVELTVSSPSAVDYLLSLVIDEASGSGNNMLWNAGAGTSSYVLGGTGTPTSTWGASLYTNSSAIHGLAEMAVWTSTGTVTSQIYDTQMTNPAYSTLSWASNGTGGLTFRVRSASNSDMSDAVDWAAASTYASSPAALSIGGARYVQWQATLTAASPYAAYPEIDDVLISWPGQTAIVDVSGYFTKRPNYGIFSVEVDDETLVNALNIEMTASREYQGQVYSANLAVEVKARNTGK